MASLYISIIMIFRVIQAIFSKRSSNGIKNATMMVGYIAFKYAISAVLGLLLIVILNNGFKVDWLTVIIAGASGVALFFSGYCSIYAMKSGTVSLNSIFGTAGMIIPIIAGAILFNNPVAPMQLVGLVIFFAAAYLMIGASKKIYSNFSYKTLLLLIGSMVANGCTMLAQQMFTTYVPDGDVSVFSFFSFAIISVLSAIFYKSLTVADKEKKETGKLTKDLIICGVALAASVFVINQLATMSTRLVPPVILFTFINGGGTIISTIVAALLYKEKISKRNAAGVILGILSLIMIKVFA